MEHDIPGLEIPVHECVRDILQQVGLQAIEIVLQHLLVELHGSGLEKAVFEIIEIKIDHPRVEGLGRIAYGEIQPKGSFDLDRRQLGDRTQQQGALRGTVGTRAARFGEGVI